MKTVHSRLMTHASASGQGRSNCLCVCACARARVCCAFALIAIPWCIISFLQHHTLNFIPWVDGGIHAKCAHLHNATTSPSLWV